MPGHIEQLGEKYYSLVIDAGRDPLSGKRIRHYQAFHGGEKEAKKELNRLVAASEQGVMACRPKGPSASSPLPG